MSDHEERFVAHPSTAPLLESLEHYLAERGIDMPDPSVDHLAGEVEELREAIKSGDRTAICHELADVVLGATVEANAFGVTIEECIAMKTDHDRGRGLKAAVPVVHPEPGDRFEVGFAAGYDYAKSFNDAEVAAAVRADTWQKGHDAGYMDRVREDAARANCAGSGSELGLNNIYPAEDPS